MTVLVLVFNSLFEAYMWIIIWTSEMKKRNSFTRNTTIFSFNTQDLPWNHFIELEPPVKILLLIINIIIITIL